MARVYIGIGSNIDKHVHIPQVLTELRATFDEITISPIYQTSAIGFEGDDFYNLVVGVDTLLSPTEVYRYLRELEANHQRKRTSQNQFVARTLDLDQLLYDDLQIDDGVISIPHDDIINYAFVLKPLADIASDLVHPILHTTIGSLWDKFDKQSIELHPICLENFTHLDTVKSTQ